MSRMIVLLGAATVAFGSASAYLSHELNEAREREASLEARVQMLEHPRPAANPFTAGPPPARAPSIEPAAAEAVRPPAIQAPAPTAVLGTTAAPGRVFNRQEAMERSRKLMQDPEYRKAMLAQQKMAMLRMYPDLRAALRLQPNEAEQLMDLLAQQQLQQMDLRPPFAAAEGPPDEAAMRQWRQQVEQQQRERETQIAALLGEAKSQEWKDYQSSLGARMQVRELRTLLDGSVSPLREDQVQPLVTALASEQQRRNQDMQTEFLGRNTRTSDPAERLSFMEQNLERTEQHHGRLHDAAAPYLSNDQLKRFDELLNQQVEMQRVSLKMMRAQVESGVAEEPVIQALRVGSSQAVIASQ